MKIGILGTGSVGTTIGTKLVKLGHEVKLGGRSATNEKALAWAKESGPRASAGTFADAAAHGEVLFNCTMGTASLEALGMAGAANLRGKLLLDVSNPLDFSKGFPPTLTVSNTDSLAEQIQRAYPDARVVKTLNTMWAGLMVEPRMLPESHQVFLSGNDAGAKTAARALLKEFGWRDEEFLDLGDLTTARGVEMWLPLWTRIYAATQNGAFNLRLVTAKK